MVQKSGQVLNCCSYVPYAQCDVIPRGHDKKNVAGHRKKKERLLLKRDSNMVLNYEEPLARTPVGDKSCQSSHRICPTQELARSLLNVARCRPPPSRPSPLQGATSETSLKSFEAFDLAPFRRARRVACRWGGGGCSCGSCPARSAFSNPTFYAMVSTDASVGTRHPAPATFSEGQNGRLSEERDRKEICALKINNVLVFGHLRYSRGASQ